LDLPRCHFDAGYSRDDVESKHGNLEDNFFNLNPGLESRFPIKLVFKPYNTPQLVDIFKLKVAKASGWKLAPECTDAALVKLLTEHKYVFKSGGNHSNARGVETLAARARQFRLEDHGRKVGELDMHDVINALKDMQGIDVIVREAQLPLPARSPPPTAPAAPSAHARAVSVRRQYLDAIFSPDSAQRHSSHLAGCCKVRHDGR
jgi:hypothetical protein